MKELASIKPIVFFSNQMEILAESLAEQLFMACSDPFAERFILVPHHGLKQYLFSFLARHPKWQIAAGLQVKTLIEGAKQLLKRQTQSLNIYFPSRFDLSFKIENEICLLLESQEERKDPLLIELCDYLDFQSAKDLAHVGMKKKISALSDELSKMFYEYAVFEREGLVQWLERKTWKQGLWKTIFSSDSSWDILSEALSTAQPGSFPIHIFGFNHLPSCYFEFFNRGTAHYYFLSPCELFWEDLCSDRERVYLEKVLEGKKVRFQIREQMSFYLKQRNPILANWGKVGQQFLKQLGEQEAYLEEKYAPPINSSQSLLSHVQQQLLELDCEKERKPYSEQDSSLLCMSATSKLREVEALLEKLYDIMQEDQTILPKDILVLSCDLDGYLPYIHMVFGVQSCPLDYSIHGLPLSCISEPVQAIESFFWCARSRFTLKDVLHCFSWPSIQKRLGWNAHHLHLIENWFKKANVLWGIDAEHKQSFFKGEKAEDLSEEEQNTWEASFDRLLMGLIWNVEIEAEDTKIPLIWPLSGVEWNEAEFLGTFIHIMKSLKDDLKPIYQQEQKTFSEWVSYVDRLLKEYVLSENDEQGLLKEFHGLSKQLAKGPQATISFDSFWRGFKSLFHRKKESFHSSHLHAVQFTALENGNVFPSKVICVLGCDENAFPRTEVLSCLEEKGRKKSLPSNIDLDRYLFLELLIHARKYLVLSYQRISWTDQKKQNPSFSIQELFAYLDQKFQSSTGKKPSEVFWIHHPAMSFHKSYFQEHPHLKSFSILHELSAKSYYGALKQEMKPFFSQWYSYGASEADKEETSFEIDLKQLRAFAKDPMQYFLREKLGIFFEFSVTQDPEFVLPYVSRSRLRSTSLRVPYEKLIEMAKAKGELPLGPFAEVALSSFMEEVEDLKQELSALSIHSEDVFQIELNPACRHPEKRNETWVLPALEIPLSKGRRAVIKGELSPICHRGFLCLGKRDYFEEMIKIWPMYLTFLCIASQVHADPQCFFLSVKKPGTIVVQDPFMLLRRYLEYYLRAEQQASPLKAEWAHLLVHAAGKELKKKVQPKSSSETFKEAHIDWLFKRDPLPEAENLHSFWKEDWEAAFAPLLEGKTGEGHEDI